MNARKGSPRNAELEAALLGLILRDPHVLDRADVHADLFDGAQHRTAFGVLQQRRHEGAAIDLVSGADAWAAAGIEGAHGWAMRCFDLAEPVVAAGVIPHLSRVATQRLYWRAARTLDAMAEETHDEGHAETLNTLLDQLAHGTDRTAHVDGQLASDVVRDYIETVTKHGGMPGIPTGFPMLDAIFGGFRPAEFSVLAARTSVGKSAMSLALALPVARCSDGADVLSLEMSMFQVGERLTAGATGMSTMNVRRGAYSPDDLDRLADAPNAMPPNLRVWDVADATTGELIALMRRALGRRKVGLFVIDHMGFIREPREYGENDAKRYGRMCRALKMASRTLGVHILALHQLKRRSEDGPTMTEPALSDLRDSGEIEEYADNVLLLHRETRDATDATLIVAKNRQGPVGEFPLRFVKHTTQFVPVGA